MKKCTKTVMLALLVGGTAGAMEMDVEHAPQVQDQQMFIKYSHNDIISAKNDLALQINRLLLADVTLDQFITAAEQIEERRKTVIACFYNPNQHTRLGTEFSKITGCIFSKMWDVLLKRQSVNVNDLGEQMVKASLNGYSEEQRDLFIATFISVSNFYARIERLALPTCYRVSLKQIEDQLAAIFNALQ